MKVPSFSYAKTTHACTCTRACFSTVFIMFITEKNKEATFQRKKTHEAWWEGNSGADISHALDRGAKECSVGPGSLIQSLLALLILSRSFPAAQVKGTALQVSDAILLHPSDSLAESFLSREIKQKDRVSSFLCSGKICSDHGELRALSPKVPGEAAGIQGRCMLLSSSVCSVVLIKSLEIKSVCSSALSSEELPETNTRVVNTPAV